MGFHFFDILILVGIGLLIFGPQALLKMARDAGKGVKQASNVKDQVLSELPAKELSDISQRISRIPTSPQQAIRMLITPPKEQEQHKQEQEPETKSQGKQS